MVPVDRERGDPVIIANETLHNGGKRIAMRFPNGYGVSVISGPGAYGTCELAVLRFTNGDDPDDFTIVYDTPVTGDVLPCNTAEDLVNAIRAVEALGAPQLPKGH
jgi:hypothetical protein